ncbi:MAG: CoA transferase [Oscillospiraceae bacterium]|jgi:crotonobetainyl-CoA:carnitine CoA-transferase CaiB-like acyl-CoA transferase|nr:CoA transferase [Oscillospiraceae bacterium]
MSEKIMSGIKVVDMSTYVAGPMCARVLGDWGADVIRIESCKGDPVRVLGANMLAPTDEEENPPFFVMNSNKRIIALNQRTEEGKAIVQKLVGEADVFITNFRKDALEAMDLDYETLKTKNPRLIFAHILGFGEKGPDAARPAFDFTTYFARSGFMRAMADGDGPPTINAPGFGDNQLAMFLAGGISAALYKREKIGQGDYVNVSLYHCGIFAFAVPLSAEPYASLYPYTRTHPLTPLVNTYQCSDGVWYYLGTPDYVTYFARAARALELDELAENEEYSSIMGMLMNIEEIVQMFDAKFIQKPSAEWKEIFDKANVPGEIVCTWQDVLKDEQAYANTFLKKLNYTNGNTGVLATTPVRFGSMDIYDYSKLPGGIGCDSVAILKSLGMSEAEIEKLREEKVIVG